MRKSLIPCNKGTGQKLRLSSKNMVELPTKRPLARWYNHKVNDGNWLMKPRFSIQTIFGR